MARSSKTKRRRATGASPIQEHQVPVVLPASPIVIVAPETGAPSPILETRRAEAGSGPGAGIAGYIPAHLLPVFVAAWE